MILFLEDWKKYPTAIIHVNTKNKSFVRMAQMLKGFGIKNHFFMLALINPDLEFVDPFDPNLTMETMAAIAIECRENPWYFFRECARVPGIGSAESTMMDANRGNIALYFLFFNHILTILIQPRQTGKSFASDTLDVYLMNIKCQNTEINLLTKDDTLRRKNIQKIKDIASVIPRYLQAGTKDDVNNGEEITIKARGNIYRSHLPQSSEKRAYLTGRGLTSAIFKVDEAPFQSHIKTSLTAALGAQGAAVKAAKLNGTPYGTVITTTAGKKDDRDGKFIYDIMSAAAIWTEKFLDAENLEDLEKMIIRHSRGQVVRVNITLNHRQLGRTDEWLKAELDNNLQTGDDANRDFFNMWTSGSQTNPLDIDLLERIAKSNKEVLCSNISKPHGYITRWYVREEEIDRVMNSSMFALGLDPSDAGGGDDIGFAITNIYTQEVVCAGNFNETNLLLFSMFMCDFMVKYQNVIAIIERRSSGASILDNLIIMLEEKGIDPFKRLFNWVVNDYIENPDAFKEINMSMGRRSSGVYVKYKKSFGFATSGSGRQSRSELYSTTLKNAAKRSCDLVHDATLINQITGLVRKNGRIDHEDGEHDDLVIGWLLTHWLISSGKNLDFYGIDINRIKSINRKSEEEESKPAGLSFEQQQIRDEMQQIYDRIIEESDPLISAKLEHRLRLLNRQVVFEEGEMWSIDALINRAKESKKTKRINAQFKNGSRLDRVLETPYGVYGNADGVVSISNRPMGANEVYGYRGRV